MRHAVDGVAARVASSRGLGREHIKTAGLLILDNLKHLSNPWDGGNVQDLRRTRRHMGRSWMLAICLLTSSRDLLGADSTHSYCLED